MASSLNAFQIIALETYSHGEFLHLASLPSNDLDEAIKKSGDLLLAFILHEISPGQECDTLSEAILRLASAAEEIDKIVHNLHAATCSAGMPPDTRQ